MVSEGIANPRLCELLIPAVVMPTTSPPYVMRGPPELPGLMAVLVWMMSAMVCPFWFDDESSVMVLPKALMTPVVNVPDSPYGEPTATTGSPTCRVSEVGEG